MPGAITDLLDRVSDSTTGRPVISSLASPGKAIGAPSINLSDSTNWTLTTKIHISIYKTQVVAGVTIKDPTTQTDWVGTLASGTISNLTLTGGTDRTYVAGDIVELTPTSRFMKDLYDWAIAQHKQDGSHSAITADSVSVASTGDLNATGVGKLKDNGTSLVSQRTEIQYDFIASGGIWAGLGYGSTLTAGMSALVCYINGRRITISAVATRTFTASKDTYVDILDNADGTGTLVYTEVTNNANSPALAANSVRLAIIVTGASNIASAASINQGSEMAVLPNFTSTSTLGSVSDSLGNLINPRDAQRRILCIRSSTASFNTTTGFALVAGMSCTFIVPANCYRIKVSFFADYMTTNAANTGCNTRFYLNSIAGTQLNEQANNVAAANNPCGCKSDMYYPVTPGSVMTIVTGANVNSGAGFIAAGPTYPMQMTVERA